DHGSEYWRQATKLRGYGWAGYRPGDRSLHFWGSIDSVRTPNTATRLKQSLDHRFRREHYLNCAELSEAALELAVREIRERKPSVIVCYSQAGAAPARYIAASGKRGWGAHAGLCAAGRLFPARR